MQKPSFGWKNSPHLSKLGKPEPANHRQYPRNEPDNDEWSKKEEIIAKVLQYRNQHVIDHPPPRHTHLMPYLGRTAKLSRSYANHIVLALALVLCTLIILSNGISRDTGTAKNLLVQACTGLETATNSLALAPRFTAITFNRVITAMISDSLNQAARLAGAILSLVKQLILYMLFRYQRVMLCVLQLGILSATNAVSTHAQQITEFLNTQLHDISGTLAAGLNGITTQIQSIDSAIDKIPKLPFGGGISIPHIDSSGLSSASDKLNALKLPSSFQQTLQGLSSSVPTLDDIEAKISAALSRPFDDLSGRVATALRGIKVSNTGVLPVMEPIQPIRFCYGDSFNLHWIDRVAEALTVALWYGCLFIMIGILCVIIANVIWTLWEHSLHEQNVLRLQTMLSTSSGLKGNDVDWSLIGTERDPTLRSNPDKFVLRSLITAVQFPVLAALFGWICRCMSRKHQLYPLTTAQIRIMWTMLYVAHPFSLMCIVFGATGLVVVRFQIYLVGLIIRYIVPLLGHEVIQALDSVITRIAGSIDAVVGPYITEVNTDINNVETQINSVLVGWANDTLRETEAGIDTVMAGFNEALHTVFGAVPGVQSAVVAFTTCVIGNHSAFIHNIQSTFTNGVLVTLPRANASDFAMDTPKLMMAMKLTSQAMNLSTDASGSVPSVLFFEQLTWMQTEYEKTLWLQMLPFWVALGFGVSLIVIAILTIVTDIIYGRFVPPNEQ
ncbi:hypothetical protein BASA50_002912 [Batrachochytrium salamandrivorans]|uniref:Plasma membrane fusion protein PRM1 n=1 Tax=Batrachochytrium salamandrivorans TaxID=1357716 RepID=A0ABQ8FJW7_9FUNG|nr:hypothetical protein BASA50_002912 [Batrachochytrium salamandrivorans]KAH9267974.1 hypothetical protein BASA84_000439 [Batrachochytrium salamandrivorans]